MASFDKAAVATGADAADALRRRNVPASQPTPAEKPQPEDNKKALKKVREPPA